MTAYDDAKVKKILASTGAEIAQRYRRNVILIEQVREAITNEGPAPKVHHQIMARHRAEWPTLWAAIDRLLSE